jgi:hypothetical protein
VVRRYSPNAGRKLSGKELEVTSPIEVLFARFCLRVMVKQLSRSMGLSTLDVHSIVVRVRPGQVRCLEELDSRQVRAICQAKSVGFDQEMPFRATNLDQ